MSLVQEVACREKDIIAADGVAGAACMYVTVCVHLVLLHIIALLQQECFMTTYSNRRLTVYARFSGRREHHSLGQEWV